MQSPCHCTWYESTIVAVERFCSKCIRLEKIFTISLYMYTQVLIITTAMACPCFMYSIYSAFFLSTGNGNAAINYTPKICITISM